MKRFLRHFLTTSIIGFFCLTVKAEMEVARINDKDGFTNIRDGQGTEFKIVGTINADDFFSCEQTTADWWKVSALKWTDRWKQIEGYIFKDKVQFLSKLPDTTKQKLIQTIFAKQKDLASKFRSFDSATYRSTISALENYSDIKYSPILPIFSDYFCKTKDSITLKQFFATLWADKGSANEMPSFALGDCFICHSDIVLRQLKSMKNKAQLNLLVSHIEWGLRSHFNVPEEGLDLPENTNKKEVDDFNRLVKKLKTIKQ